MSSRDAAAGYAALVEAEPGYTTARNYFDGTVGEVFTTPALKRALRKSGGDKFKMNVIQSVVTSISDRLELISITVEGASGDAPIVKVDGKPVVSPAQRLLDAIWKANSLLFEAPNVMRNTSRDGDGFVMVWAEEPDEDDAPMPLPVINYLSPTVCRIVYDADNPRQKRYAVHTWEVKGEGDQTSQRCNVLYPDVIERFVTKPGMKPTDPDAWTEYLVDPAEPDSWTTENPFGEIPVFHFRNETPYGMPEHVQGYGAQDAINKIVIAHMSTVDFHIAPQRYAYSKMAGASAEPDDFDLDDDFEDDPSSEVKTGRERELSKGMRSGPAEFWHLKGVDGVGQFAPADAKNFIDPAGFYLRMMSQTTRTPLHMIDESGDEPSGESRRRKDAPLTKKVRDRQMMYAATWAEVLAFALKCAGLKDRSVVVRFAPAEVVSDAEGWATIKSKIEAGVPVRQALSEAGYTAEQIGEWFPEGEENSFRVADLVQVADILQKISAAVAMGLISSEEGRAMLPEGLLPEGAPAPPSLPSPIPPSA